MSVYINRNDYLKSLPKDEYGSPIVDKKEFSELAYEHDWERDFLEDAIQHGIVHAEYIPEYFTITDEYGIE